MHHTFAAIKELGDAFEPESFAAFCQLESRHIVAIVDALTALNLMPVTRKTQRQSRGQGVKTRLADTWVMPEEWVLIARERRFWPLDVCRTEAERFADWHRMKGNAFADWKAAWRNWIDGSRRETGSPSDVVAGRFDDDAAKRAYIASLP